MQQEKSVKKFEFFIDLAMVAVDTKPINDKPQAWDCPNPEGVATGIEEDK